MNFEELKKDMEQFMEKKMEPINQKMIEQEKERHTKFLEKHSEKFDKLIDKHSSTIAQLIALEGVIFAAIIIFSRPESITIYLVIGICLVLVSLFFGVWLQNISMQSEYQSHEWEHNQEVKHDWWIRDLWKDPTVKAEKEMVEPHLNEQDEAYKKTFTYKILNFLGLDHDRVENIFKISFLLSLLFLIIHFICVFIGVGALPSIRHSSFINVRRYF